MFLSVDPEGSGQVVVKRIKSGHYRFLPGLGNGCEYGIFASLLCSYER